jgi:aromatic-L-amino-acid decarboxylase
MQPEALHAAIALDLANGVTPVAVIATAGTTLTGSVDPIAALADICESFGIWLHVDGAYGLPAASAPLTAPLFAGLSRADSVSVDAHKWMFVPKACSAVLVRDAQTLARTFAHDEAYIPHEDDELNAVDITLEYSRPLRAMKLWLALRVHGAQAFRAAIAENCEQAQHLYRSASAHPRFEVLASPPQLSIVPFRHVLPGCTDLDAHNLDVCARMQRDGRVYISPATIDGQVWLRPCFTNFRTTMADVDITLEVADELGSIGPHDHPPTK